MRKVSALILVLVVAFALSLLAADTANAVPAFDKAWKERYTKENQALKAKADKVKCNVCHMKTDKKLRNAYGEALAELLDKKADIKDLEKINKAFDEVEAKHVVPDDEASPTYGDRLKEGELPVDEAA